MAGVRAGAQHGDPGGGHEEGQGLAVSKQAIPGLAVVGQGNYAGFLVFNQNDAFHLHVGVMSGAVFLYSRLDALALS